MAAPSTDDEDVVRMAQYLGMDPVKDKGLFWIAEEALDAPLPDGWVEHEDSHGPFFLHVASKKAYRQHPLDDYFKSLVVNIRDKSLTEIEARVQSEKSAPWAPKNNLVGALQGHGSRSGQGQVGPSNSFANLERLPTMAPGPRGGAQGVVDDIQKLRDQIRALEDKLRRAEERSSLLQEDVERERRRSEQILEKAMKSAAEAGFRSGTEDTSVQILREEGKRRLEEVEAVRQELREAERRREAEAESLRSRLEEAHREAAAHREAEASLRVQVSAFSSEVSGAQSTLKSAFEDVKIAQGQLHAAQLEALKAKTDAEAAEREKAMVQAQLDEALRRLEDASRSSDSTQQETRDLRAAAQQLQVQVQQARSDVQLSQKEIAALRAERDKLREERDKLAAAPPAPPAPPQVVQVDNPQLQAELQRSQLEVQQLRFELSRAKDDLQRALTAGPELTETRAEVQRLRQESAVAQQEIAHLRDELQRARAEAGEARETLRKRETDAQAAGHRLREVQARAEALQSQYLTHAEELARRDAGLAAINAERRRLFNELLQLKGNIRVFCRVRPVSDAEKTKSGTQEVFGFPDKQMGLGRFITQEMDGRESGRREPKTFEFDRVFGPDSTQQSVFEDVQPLVQSVLDGFNVTIFAYGQTGSGKTHTMEGPSGDRGVTYRAFEEMFRLTAESNDKGGINMYPSNKFEFKVQLFEIYNESIRDLFVAPKDRGSLSHDVKVGDDGLTYVTDLIEAPVSSADDFVRCMKAGAANRAVAGTNMNQHSSRSHLIMVCHVTCFERATGARKYVSKLCLVDLAGSERVGKSGAEGDRLKEAIAINKSLSALGDCISALASKAKGHVPYRNSKLTYVLSDSLGNDAKTLLIVNCSPALYNAQESMCTLMFAARARNVDLSAGASNSSMRQALQRGQQVQRDLERRVAEVEETNSRLRQELASKDGTQNGSAGVDQSKVEALERENRALRQQLAESSQSQSQAGSRNASRSARAEGGEQPAGAAQAQATAAASARGQSPLGSLMGPTSGVQAAAPNRLQPVLAAPGPRPSRGLGSRQGDPFGPL